MKTCLKICELYLPKPTFAFAFPGQSQRVSLLNKTFHLMSVSDSFVGQTHETVRQRESSHMPMERFSQYELQLMFHTLK